MADRFSNRKPTKDESEEAFNFWHGKFREYRRKGYTRRQARKFADQAGEEKYGKIDWAALLKTLLPLILQLIALFSK